MNKFIVISAATTQELQRKLDEFSATYPNSAIMSQGFVYNPDKKEYAIAISYFVPKSTQP